ncbi:MAG TPA: hypothetical protein VFQ61_14790 [Polyangiaceae bacterium]|nr:hypothetical protein [Polyangiaceae bacterium]
MPAPTSAPQARDQVFYRYETADGRVVIVDSLDQVPPGIRPRIEQLHGSSHDGSSIDSTQGWNWGKLHVDGGSFGLGFGSALFAIGALALLVRSKRLLGALFGLGLAIAIGAVYLGWLRRTTAQPGAEGSAPFATPQDIVQDAKRAVERAKLRQAEQDRAIEQIQKEAR